MHSQKPKTFVVVLIFGVAIASVLFFLKGREFSDHDAADFAARDAIGVERPSESPPKNSLSLAANEKTQFNVENGDPAGDKNPLEIARDFSAAQTGPEAFFFAQQASELGYEDLSVWLKNEVNSICAKTVYFASDDSGDTDWVNEGDTDWVDLPVLTGPVVK